MPVWIDAQISPALAGWLRLTFGADAHAIRDLELREAEVLTIFARACEAGAVVLTKDGDLVDLLDGYGPPPQVVWLTCGNTSNAYLRQLLVAAWPRVTMLLAAGEPLVEINEPGA